MSKKKASSNIATGIAIGMAAGVTLGAIGAVEMSGMSCSKALKNAKKTLKKGADKAMSTAQNVIDSMQIL